MSSELLYRIALMQVPKIGAVTAKNLISYCGSARAVFEATKKELLRIPGIGTNIADNIREHGSLREAEKECLFLEKHGIQALFHTDKRYPQRLRHHHDSPLMLYYKGTADLNHARIVAVVGTRSPTPYGKALCEELVEGLRDYNVLVVSGLAYGVDIAAHRKSLELGIPTVGVMGHGMGRIYPPTHRDAAEQMLEAGGLLTEYASSQGPDREHFPMRNRIIAGMCDALVVVETGLRGGSMITATMANDYNKDVFAFPGRVRDKFSQGCHFLIKTHKAQLIEQADDIAYLMRWETTEKNNPVQQQLFVDLNEREQAVVALLKENCDTGIDRLQYETRLSSSELASLMLELEFKGIVRCLPGKRYALI